MNRLLRISVISALALSASACRPHVSGNGVLGEEQRNGLPAFTGVDISLGAEATVTANAPKQTVTVSVDENLLQYILTPVENLILKTRLNGITGIDSVHPLRIVAQAKVLTYVRATEASFVDVKGAGDTTAGFTFVVEAGGVSNVQLAGIGGDELKVTLSNHSALDARAYPVAGANVMLSGGSHLQIYSTGDVVGTASDASTVELRGAGTCAALVLTGLSTCTKP
jgi:Putative auto-transporter adhesin, head GIN domain